MPAPLSISKPSRLWCRGRRGLVAPLVAVGLLLGCQRGALAPAPPPASEVSAACAAPATPVTSRADEPVGLAGSGPSTDPAAVFDTAWRIIQRTHWDSSYNGTDWNAVRAELRPRAAQARTRGELRQVLSEMVGRLRQSHFAIIPQETADATPTAGSARGTGTLGFSVRSLDSRIVVSAVDSGGPAALAGVQAGWWLDAVDGCPLAPRLAQLPPHTDARQSSLDAFRLATIALAGGEGETTGLRFRDGRDVARSVTLTRAPAMGLVTKFGNLPPQTAHLTWQRVQQGGRTIGVIRFNIWMPVLAPAFDVAMDSLRGSDAIVLDIRGNFGGVGGMALGIAGHFLDSAASIGTMHQRGSTTKFLVNPRRVDTRNRPVRPYAGPLAIVVDELSVSTSEIFAGGLKELGRAEIIGSQTAGQALPSTPERLPNGDVLYHAIADFLSPNGQPVEGDGVKPTTAVSLDRRSLLAGKDPAMAAAIAWAMTVYRKPTP